MANVVNIADITTQDIFTDKEFQLGDGKGKWYVCEGDLVLGRYIRKDRAEFHAGTLNDAKPMPCWRDTDELLEYADDLVARANKILEDFKKRK